MTSQTSMWNLGEVRSNAKGGKFLCLEPLFWQNPMGAQGFFRGPAPQRELRNDARTRLFWERAETDLVEQLAAASERVAVVSSDAAAYSFCSLKNSE